MENLQSGIIPIGLFVIGFIGKLLMELYFPQPKEASHVKKNFINGSMVLVVLLMTGNILRVGMIEPWTESLYVNILSQIFLMSLFVAFLVVANALIDLSTSFKRASEDEGNVVL